MSDLLNMDLINSLPQPLWVSENGKDWWWPVMEIDVQTGLMRIDVCGQQQRCHFDDYSYIRDDAQIIHEWDTFYLEGDSS